MEIPHQGDASEHAVVVTRCEKLDAHDYCVTLRRPDGSTLDVLIPIEGTNNVANVCASTPGSPFGLNLVSNGHYL